jgi:hypothetical protein
VWTRGLRGVGRHLTTPQTLKMARSHLHLGGEGVRWWWGLVRKEVGRVCACVSVVVCVCAWGGRARSWHTAHLGSRVGAHNHDMGTCVGRSACTLHTLKLLGTGSGQARVANTSQQRPLHDTCMVQCAA